MPSGLNATPCTRSSCAGERVREGLAGGGVPEPHRVVVAGRRRVRVPSGLNATPLHLVRVSGEGPRVLAGGGVPDLHRPVVAGGGEAGAVGAERDTLAPVQCSGRGLAEQSADGLAGGRVPAPHGLVETARRRGGCRRG